jgi:coenzyme F420-reducing hydrogenase beta subunit
MINIINKKECTGCSACFSICPQHCIGMLPDKEGFLYPRVIKIEKCINCGLCDQVCPVINMPLLNYNSQGFAMINKNQDIRQRSSSGGIFELLARYVIKSGGVVFGAKFDMDFNVIHSYTECLDGVLDFQGSKYVQSVIGYSYINAKKKLDLGRLVLFSGTPCQIGGLRNFLGKKYDNLLCVDIVCHSVPSPLVWKKYLVFREKSAHAKIKRIFLRYKESSWRFYKVLFQFENQSSFKMRASNDLYIRGFLSNLYNRPSCSECKFKGEKRISDITLADFWGIEYIFPDMNDDKGTSLILINSIKGKQIFQEIKSDILYQEIEVEIGLSYNLSALISAKDNIKREEFFQDLMIRETGEVLKNYCSIGLKNKIKEDIYYFYNKIKKIL